MSCGHFVSHYDTTHGWCGFVSFGTSRFQCVMCLEDNCWLYMEIHVHTCIFNTHAQFFDHLKLHVCTCTEATCMYTRVAG